ncbi:MAG: Snf7 family protein [Candidatus Lokiarchaeota archaeon]|nr:Snf7 family protein [Candidatus Lokiarchaeota archaeon]
MGLKKKLFPRKGKEKINLVAKAKGHIHKLNMMNKNYNRRAEISRKNAKIALKRGEKGRAKSYLVQYKSYEAKVDRSNNIRLKIERQIQAIEEGTLISQTGDVMGGIRDELEYIATKASPVKVAEIAEDSEAYVSEIEEAAEILGGDPEIDLAIDVTDELNQLETEMLLDQGGTMPEIPSDELAYIPEFDEFEEEAEVKSKDKLKDEIDKLRKELEG